ncbi:MAG: bifunctional UDP-N-acetylglucosamine diphosphorylase/glucosamine-1-phosphate N-acetyltransferase GlmU [Chloroflexi bacterium]|nr:MAG: bifunctional UDP-N-acetylglucosamine diphosphorylase/glucosamine-1-phosphate N-acetyltransferase GlmU [Chloroflexota bacterium]
MTLAVVLLAAGKGKRMLSKTQKILHEVGGKPMVQHVFEAAVSVSEVPPILVVGPGETGVQDLLGDRADYALQPEALGTGHATQMAKGLANGRSDQLIVTYGDMPLLRATTMVQQAKLQAETGAAVVMLSVMAGPENTFGRVVRDENGRITEILELANARRRPNAAELVAIPEQNVGVYCFDADWLWQNIDNLPLRQARSGHEYYLTDMIEMAVQQGRLVESIVVEDADEALGAGTRKELVNVEKAFRRRANAHWLDNGVTLIDPNTIYIDPDVTIGQDTIIWPNTYLQGQTTIGEDCVIGPNSIIRNANIGSNCQAEQVVVADVDVADGTVVGDQ